VHSILLDGLPPEWIGGISERDGSEFTTIIMVSHESWADCRGKSITLTPPVVAMKRGGKPPDAVTIRIRTKQKKGFKTFHRERTFGRTHETWSEDIFERLLVFQLHDWSAVYDSGNGGNYRYGAGRITASCWNRRVKDLPDNPVIASIALDSPMTEVKGLTLKLSPVVVKGMLHLQAKLEGIEVPRKLRPMRAVYFR